MTTTNHNSFNNYSPAQLDEYIRELQQSAQDSILRICEVLLEKKERGLTHELFNHRYCQHFELIATGQTTVSFVQIVEGNKAKILKLAGYPHGLLDDIANGREFDIVAIKNGVIVETRKRMTSMSNAELNRTFPGNSHLSTISEQREKLEAEISLRNSRAATANPPIVTSKFTAKKGAIYYKNERFTIDDFLPSIEALGYKLIKV